MLNMRVRIEGRTILDLECALDEIRRSFESGNINGADSDASGGGYVFAVEGTDESEAVAIG